MSDRYRPVRLGVWPEDLRAALERKSARFDDVLGLIDELYAIHPTGGPLHVQLDDGNIEGEIRPRYDGYADAELDALYFGGWPIAELDPAAPAVVEGLGRSTRQICDELAAKLNAMPVDDRLSVLAHHGGYATASSEADGIEP